MVSDDQTKSEPWKSYPILVVDDEQHVVETLSIALETAGFRCTTASSGEQALEFLEASPAKLVISDYAMHPGITGSEFLSAVKKRYPQTVTMMLSAHSDSEYLMRAVNEAGVYQYMLKPYTKSELLLRVSQALQYSYHQDQMRHMAERKAWMLRRVAQAENFSMFGAFGDFMSKRFNTMTRILPSAAAAYLAEGQKQGGAVLRDAMRLQDDALLFSAVLKQIAMVGENFTAMDPKEVFKKQSPMPIILREFQKAEAAAHEQQGAMKWEFVWEAEEDIPELWISEKSFRCALHNLLENAIVYSMGAVQSGAARKVTVRTGFFSPDKLHKTGKRTIEKHPPPVMEEDTFWLEVEDSGKGMKSFDSDRRFRFFNTQADQDIAASANPEKLSPFKDEYNLTPYLHIGMGLPVAQWCISSHDGNLRLLNPGQSGACMRIDIPLEQQELTHRLGLK